MGHETDSNGDVGVWYVEIAECWDDEDLESDDPNDEGYGIDQTGNTGFFIGHFSQILIVLENCWIFRGKLERFCRKLSVVDSGGTSQKRFAQTTAFRNYQCLS